ncbi:hypothetical protein DUI87_23377 [Hirundo rustica rustica]|uniref:Uncharacterized protein n=1 Tax=Hirundo rustica rustica TaxID=333673 RepID=A0A3M0JGH2_HIRRU|nr:hypothetical protein DUI87_23377 [Hirundo rustica rustica]
MEPPEGWDPYGRPARRTQWLVSALAFHYGLDRGVENERVVLVTGLDKQILFIIESDIFTCPQANSCHSHNVAF